MTKTTVLGLSFDTHDAARVARFWADALGRQLADGATAHDAVVLPGDDSQRRSTAGLPSSTRRTRRSRTASTSTSSRPTSTASQND